MRAGDAATDDGRTLTVRVPLTVRKRGGRKQVVMPEGACWGQPRPRVDNTMVKAIARAHRWKRLMESGRFASVTELAEAEKINQSYLCRVLRLTLLAPDIVEMILDGRQPVGLQMDALLRPFPSEWMAQRQHILDR
ncbi:hypothetical protein MIC97_01530 [Aquamicrobium sp. NLF2-7]|uniref:hypothetical protein n=1 Tax=Aquamicrobium sp. NLF2-7 TaxID=2918753 RepID=UPI001EFA90E6|nr:hypothetical protein [Aquamicrobium sp. NLF2-7]MCG8270194.1 hypothetical protein [Aquamicrobium sp. NLF2-7]